MSTNWNEFKPADPKQATVPSNTNWDDFTPVGEQNDIGRGLMRGAVNVGKGVARSVEGAATVAHGMGLKKMAANVAGALDEYSKPYAPATGRVEDIHGVGDAVDYAQGMIAEQVPNMAATAAGAWAGGKAGFKVGGIRGAALGALGGGALASFPLQFGETYGEQRDTGLIDDPGRALAYAIPQAALDAVPIGHGVGKIITPLAEQAGAGLIKRVAKGIGEGMVSEGITETAQEGLGIAHRSSFDPNYDVLGADAQSRLLNSAVGGALAGGGFGGASAALAGTAAPEAKPEQNGPDLAPTPPIESSVPPSNNAPGLDAAAMRASFNRGAFDATMGERIRTLEGEHLPPELPKGPLARAAAMAVPGLMPEGMPVPYQAQGEPAANSGLLPRQMLESNQREGEWMPADAQLGQQRPALEAAPIDGEIARPAVGSNQRSGEWQAADPSLSQQYPALDRAPIDGSSRPINEAAQPIDDAAHQAATSPLNNLAEPTEAQQKAGNYKKGHVRLLGLNISIENPQGSVRRGVDPDGKAWENQMPHHYGYIKRSLARDGDQLDTYIGPNTNSRNVFVVDQIDPQTGKFDEHKIMLGFDSQSEAEQAYRSAYAPGWQGMGKVTALDIDSFKGWMKKGNTKRALAPVANKYGGSVEAGLIANNPAPNSLAPSIAPNSEQMAAPAANNRPASSWVIREKSTGNVIAETFDQKKVNALNTDKYEAVPIDQYLPELNRSIAAKKNTIDTVQGYQAENNTNTKSQDNTQFPDATKMAETQNAPTALKASQLANSAMPSQHDPAYAQQLKGKLKAYDEKQNADPLERFLANRLGYAQPTDRNNIQPSKEERKKEIDLRAQWHMVKHVREGGQTPKGAIPITLGLNEQQKSDLYMQLRKDGVLAYNMNSTKHAHRLGQNAANFDAIQPSSNPLQLDATVVAKNASTDGKAPIGTLDGDLVYRNSLGKAYREIEHQGKKVKDYLSDSELADLQAAPMPAQPVAKPQPKKSNHKPDRAQDTALEFIAKHGGIDPADPQANDLRTSIGAEPGKNVRIVGIRQLFAGKGKGMSIDSAAQLLWQHGYLDAHDSQAMLNKLLDNGDYHGHHYDHAAAYEAAQQEREADATPIESASDEKEWVDNFSDLIDDFGEEIPFEPDDSNLSAEMEAWLNENESGITEGEGATAGEIQRTDAGNAGKIASDGRARAAPSQNQARTDRPSGHRQGGETDAFALSGESNTEILTREKTAQQQAEQERARNAAPSADDFTLTGSDRTADVAAAHGAQDLFAEPAPQAKPTLRDKIAEIHAGKTAEQGAPEFPTKQIGESYRHISHSTRSAGMAEQEQYKRSLERIRSEVDPLVETDAQRVAYDAALLQYQQTYINESIQLAGVRENTHSSFVAGRNNFNGKQAARTGGAYEAAMDRFGKAVAKAEADVKHAVLRARTPEQLQAERDQAATKAREKSITDFARRVGAIADDLRNGRTETAKDTRKWAGKELMKLLDDMDSATQLEAVQRVNEAVKDLGGLLEVVGKRSLLATRISKIMAEQATTEQAKAGQGDPRTQDADTQNNLTSAEAGQGGEPLTDAPDNEQDYDGNEATTLAGMADFQERLQSGKVKLAEYQARFASLERDKADVLAQMAKQTKAQLLDGMGAFKAARYRNESKNDIIRAAWSDMLSEFILTDSFSYGMGNYEASIRQRVANTTQADLTDFAERLKAARAERERIHGERQAGIENPQTLADFQAVMRQKREQGIAAREAYLSLTPEQQANYDALAAESTREARERRQQAERNRVQAAQQTTGANIIETKHTKKGHALFVVQLGERVDRDSYNTLNSNAKRMGGYYSAYRGGGAVPGFQFTERAQAEAFAKLVQGDSSAASEAIAARRDAFEDDKSQSAAERLRAMADKLYEVAGEAMGRERKVNTARRARMASAAEAAARKEQAMAATMRKLAEAIDNGKAQFLSLVRQKVQIEHLETLLGRAKWTELNARYPNYAEQQKHLGEGATRATIAYTEWPQYSAWQSDLAGVARDLLQIDGAKKLGERLQKVADDVTDEYMAYARDNLYKFLGDFSFNNGMPAIYGNREQAERAIARAGLRGRAIVLPVKRGENAIIISPKLAKEKGVWQAEDKRIVLSDDFGREVAEKLAELKASMGSKAPYHGYLQSTFEQRKRLSGMGIETASELRAALREYLNLRKAPDPSNKIKEMERAMVGRKADGLDFFPTPADTVQRMLDAAELDEHMTVLEPSAGMGHIAELIRATGVEPDVIEFSPERRELLEAKGFHVVGNDFIEAQPNPYTFGDIFRAPDGSEGVMQHSQNGRVQLHDEASGKSLGWFTRSELEPVRHRQHGKQGGYDRIIMNPPFSQRRDAEHVMHAYDLLKPNGRIVAIMGEGVFFGQDKKAQAFRDWLDQVGGTSEQLEAGSFLDPSLPVNTGVNARMVVIDKPTQAPAVFSRSETKAASVQLDFRQAIRAVTQQLDQLGLSLDTVEVVKSFDSLPPEIKAQAKREGTTNIQGAFHTVTGKTYIVADQHSSLAELEETVLHELYGHGGVRALMGTRPERQLLQLFREFDRLDGLMPILQRYGVADAVMAEARNIMATKAKESDKAARIMDEVLAYLSQHKPDLRQKLMSLIGRFRLWLRQHGFAKLAKLGESDMAYLLTQLHDAARNGGPKPGQNGVVFRRAWHGTPHDFERFSTDSIGTGEGQQAYGYGLYFASKREVADWYRNALSRGQSIPEVDGVEVQDRFANNMSANDLVFDADEMPETTLRGEDARAFLLDHLNEKIGDQQMQLSYADPNDAIDQRWMPRVQAKIEALQAMRDEISGLNVGETDLRVPGKDAMSGKLYEVEINDDAPYLDWDKSLDEQSAEVKALIWESGSQTGKAFYKNLSKQLGSDKAASDFLQGVGLGGIQFLDGSSRGQKNGEGTHNYVVFNDQDVNIVAKYRRRPVQTGTDWLAQQGDMGVKVGQSINDLASTHKTFNGWWHKTVGTQYHKAAVDADFAKVFNRSQAFLNDVSRFAMNAENAAPDVLVKMGSLQDVWTNRKKITHFKQQQADLQMVGEALFEGTLYQHEDGHEGKVWTDDELAARGMTPQQISMYHQSRAAIVQSLSDLTRSVMAQQVRNMDASGELVAAFQEPMIGYDKAYQYVQSKIADQVDAAGGLESEDAAPWLTLSAQLYDANAKFRHLELSGYAPLQRYGKYTVDVVETGKDGKPGERQFFGMYESEREANSAARELRAEFPTATVTQGVQAENEHLLYNGVSPETMRLFAKELGIDQDPAMQAYYQKAVSNHSALRRLIKRKGIAGYSGDTSRVLASFVTSNARATSRNFHMGKLSEAIEAIPKAKGDVREEAIKLQHYLTNPQEEAQGLRGFMFMHFIGGSVASAAVNLTQPILMTFPHLSQLRGPAAAAKALALAAKDVWSDRLEPELAAAIHEAEAEGIVSPHEIHQLMAEAGGGLVDRYPAMRAFKALWGSLFSATETINRRLSFIAAYRLARESNNANPYQFATKAVMETQGIYNKGNRPNWARGAAGATLFTFKQFSITYVEWFKRLPSREKGVALAMLFLMSGMQGLPGADDAQDLIDAIGRMMGYDTNSRARLKEIASDALGKAGGEFMTRGVSSVIPLDIAGRVGMGNLIPGTRALVPYEQQSSKDALEFMGPVGGLIQSLSNAIEQAARGDIGAAALNAAPVAIQNIAKGVSMAQKGYYEDSKGAKVIATDSLDAALKSIGFQPSDVAQVQAKKGDAMRMREVVNQKESDIAQQWARGVVEGDKDRIAEARAALAAWNAKNPTARIVITPRQIANRVKQMRMTAGERLIKTTPKELRADVKAMME